MKGFESVFRILSENKIRGWRFSSPFLHSLSCSLFSLYLARIFWRIFFFKGIGEAQDYLVLSIIFTIVKYDELCCSYNSTDLYRITVSDARI